jgi:hypothetical protein
LPGEDAPRTEVEIEGLWAVVIGVEGLLLDRLRAWVHSKSEEDGRWGRRLAQLYSDRLDWGCLRSRAAKNPEEKERLLLRLDRRRLELRERDCVMRVRRVERSE